MKRSGLLTRAVILGPAVGDGRVCGMKMVMTCPMGCAAGACVTSDGGAGGG